MSLRESCFFQLFFPRHAAKSNPSKNKFYIIKNELRDCKRFLKTEPRRAAREPCLTLAEISCGSNAVNPYPERWIFINRRHFLSISFCHVKGWTGSDPLLEQLLELLEQ